MKKSNNKKLTNEEIYKKTRLSKIYWYLIIIFGLATIILAVSSLVFKISPVFCIIGFILETLFTKMRNNIREELNSMSNSH